MIKFDNSWQLGLWAKHSVEPSCNKITGAIEVATMLETSQAVDDLYKKLVQQKVEIIQQPTQLDFGYAFTIEDPDGHRLRFYNLER